MMLFRILTAGILLLYAGTAFSQIYHWGSRKCDWENIKDDHSSPLEVTKAIYYACLAIKGAGTGNQTELTTAINDLYDLADNDGNIIASDFLAQYLATGGDMKTMGKGRNNLDKAIYYYNRVLDLIAVYPGYYASVNDQYEDTEKKRQLVLKSYMWVPYLFVEKYYLGIYGSFNQMRLRSPSFTGDRGDLRSKTYYEYSLQTKESLEQVLESAGFCLSLRPQSYTNREAFNKLKELCASYKEFAIKLLVLEEQRLAERDQDYCTDILDKEKCPLFSLFVEIMSVFNSFRDRHSEILNAIMTAIIEAATYI